MHDHPIIKTLPSHMTSLTPSILLPDSLKLAQNMFEGLRLQGADGIGITRLAYTEQENAALGIIARHARQMGLDTASDAAGNLVISLRGKDTSLPALACGSHMDSVPQGGNYDGAAGVIAGIIALASLHARGARPHRNLRVYALRGEESAAFGKPYLGSSALLGRLGSADLALRQHGSGRPLGECMRACGINTTAIADGRCLLDPHTLAGWIELHIEQGPVLDTCDIPLGVVSAIRGNFRYPSITCMGESGHSGSTPPALRHDPVLAAADLLSTMEKHWQAHLRNGEDLVMTSGCIGTDARTHAIAKIADTVSFSFEARSTSSGMLERFQSEFLAQCARISAQRGVRFQMGHKDTTPPVQMDPQWEARLCTIMKAQGVGFMQLPSGAGHDAAVFAAMGVPSAMIFVRNQNGSHNPREAMRMDDFISGCETLTRMLINFM